MFGLLGQSLNELGMTRGAGDSFELSFLKIQTDLSSWSSVETSTDAVAAVLVMIGDSFINDSMKESLVSITWDRSGTDSPLDSYKAVRVRMYVWRQPSWGAATRSAILARAGARTAASAAVGKVVLLAMIIDVFFIIKK